MNGTNLFKIALRALNNNKLRAFLTMLGIIIGVASVITMLAIGQGSKKSIQAQISEMGSNMIMIHPGADMRGGVRQDPSAMQTLKLTDYETLRDETSFLAAVSPNVSSSGQLIAGNNNYPSSVSVFHLCFPSLFSVSVFHFYFHLYFPPVIAIPSINCFWNTRYRITMGTMARTEPAISTG